MSSMVVRAPPRRDISSAAAATIRSRVARPLGVSFSGAVVGIGAAFYWSDRMRRVGGRTDQSHQPLVDLVMVFSPLEPDEMECQLQNLMHRVPGRLFGVDTPFSG